MKIPAPNYTQTPNCFFDEIMKNLNEGEMKVLLVIMRQTFGWHKLEDWITLKLLAEKTGYDRRSVCRILERLIEKKLVFKRIEGSEGRQKCFYSLVAEEVKKETPGPDDGIESEEEKAIFQKSYTSDRTVTPPSDRRVTPPVTDGSPPPSIGHTYNKETKKKEIFSTKQQQEERAKPAPVAGLGKEKYFKGNQLNAGQQQTLKIYDCLRPIDIPDSDKGQITAAYNEKCVIDAIGWATSPQNPPSKCLAASIKFACRNGLSIKEFEVAKKMTGYETVSQYFKNGEKYNNAECYLTKEYIAFERGMRNEQAPLSKYYTWDKVVDLCKSFQIEMVKLK